jgi:hypothetical protein
VENTILWVFFIPGKIPNLHSNQKNSKTIILKIENYPVLL